MKKWKDVPAGELDGATKRLLVAIGDFADAVVTRINTDQEYLAEIAQMIVGNLHRPTDSQKVAARSWARTSSASRRS